MKFYLQSLTMLALLTSTLSAELVETYFKTGELKAQTNYIDGTNTPIKVGIKNGIEKDNSFKVKAIVANGKETLEYLKNNTIDILLLDIDYFEKPP